MSKHKPECSCYTGPCCPWMGDCDCQCICDWIEEVEIRVRRETLDNVKESVSSWSVPDGATLFNESLQHWAHGLIEKICESIDNLGVDSVKSHLPECIVPWIRECICKELTECEKRVYGPAFLDGRTKVLHALWGSMETLTCMNQNSSHEDCWVSYSEVLDLIDKEVNDSPSA